MAGISNSALSSPFFDETQSLGVKFQPINLVQIGHKPKQQRIITLTLNDGMLNNCEYELFCSDENLQAVTVLPQTTVMIV